jgi:hypothetical protein
MKRQESLKKLAELQAKRIRIDKLLEQETGAKKLRAHAAELEAITRQLEMLRLDFLHELKRKKAA